MKHELIKDGEYRGYRYLIKKVSFGDEEIERAGGYADWLYNPWLCGYIGIPKGHNFYEVDYNDLHEEYEFSVHGGLTYSGWLNRVIDTDEDIWVIGFDCHHYNDNIVTCNKDYAESECKSLIDQIIKNLETSNSDSNNRN